MNNVAELKQTHEVNTDGTMSCIGHCCDLCYYTEKEYEELLEKMEKEE
jgi:hypothetical protein